MGLSLLWAPPVCGFLGVYAIHAATRVESFLRSHTHSPAGRLARIIALGFDVLLGGMLGQILAIALDHLETFIQPFGWIGFYLLDHSQDNSQWGAEFVRNIGVKAIFYFI